LSRFLRFLAFLKFLIERFSHLCCHGQSLPMGGFAGEFGRGPSADIDRKLTLLRDIQINAAQSPSPRPSPLTLTLTYWHRGQCVPRACNDKVCRIPWGVKAGCSSPWHRPWARRWINHWSLSCKCNVRPTVTFPATGHHRPLTTTKLYCCLVTEAHVCEQLAQGCYLKAERPRFEPATFESQVQRLNKQTSISLRWPTALLAIAGPISWKRCLNLNVNSLLFIEINSKGPVNGL